MQYLNSNGGSEIMEFKILLLASFLLFAFFALGSHSQDPPSSVDQYIDQSNGIVNTSSSGDTPWASRAVQVGQKGKDILSQQIGGKLNTGGLTPQDSRNQEQTQTVSTQPVVANNTTQVQSKSSEVPDISGTWNLELVDSASRNATLTLLQSSGGAVYGKGFIFEGNETFAAAASGSIAGDKLNLDVVSSEKMILYRLALKVNADAATGGYDLYRPNSEVPQAGTANAMKI
jgi:hypothetical protein